MRLRSTILLALAGLLSSTIVVAQPGLVPEPPPSGPGLGQQQPPPPFSVNPVQLSPKDKEALADIEAEFERFTQAATEHDTRMRLIAKREYDSRSALLDKRYGDRIAKTEATRGEKTGDSIAKLEAFLAVHKDHEQHTPDQMFRLAKLYLDVAEAQVDAMQDAAIASGTPLPEGGVMADYSKSMDLWTQILTKFPKYRQTPSTLYLLAYYTKTKDQRKALQIFLALACANQYKWSDPPSALPTRAEALQRIDAKTLRDPYATCQPYPDAEVELVRHAWSRGVADYHFAIPGEIDDAIAAYLKVVDGGQESKLYAESLYKLAWSYYKRDRLFDSIKRFDESVRLYDAIVAQGGQPQIELRDESIQYIAVAMTDPWEGEANSDPVKAFERAKDYYKGREAEPHVRDVWVGLGRAFADLQAWDQSVDSYRIALGPPWELNPNNPVVHQEIVNVFELKGDKFAADAAAAELATRYAPGTPWYAANEKDREAMENQRRIAERALYAATRNTHSAATVLRKDYEAATTKDPALKQEYLAMYAKAVELYRTFVATYPESDYVYEFTFLQGEALYWSERYLEAVVAYSWVRDHRDLGTAYYTDAARSILLSYEAEAARQVADGKLAPLKVPTIAELKAAMPWRAQEIPRVYQQLQAEYVTFQEIVQDPQAAPGQGINAALISLAYFHVDDALERYRTVMTKFCTTPEAAQAKDGILAVYEAQSNFDAIEKTNKAFIQQKCGTAKDLELAKGQNLTLNFSRANALFAEGKHLEAAELYYRFYKTAPPNTADAPVALYNTAIAYRLAERPKTAIAMFKEYTANPAKNYRDSGFYINAMRQLASAHQAAFEYDAAVKSYLELRDVTAKARRAGMKDPEPLPGQPAQTLEQIGLDALYNAALAAELNRDFKRAIELNTEYQRKETDERKKDRALWQVAQIYRQSGDVSNMAETYARWRKTYGGRPENADDVVQTFYDEAAIRKRKAQMGLARAAGQSAIDAWKKVGAQQNTRGAKLAGEWQLQFAEDYFTQTWEPYAIKTAAKTVAEAKKQSEGLQKVKTTAEDRYNELKPYGVGEYLMALKLRYGDIQYGFATKLADAPIPVPVAKNPDMVPVYEEQRDKNTQKYLAEARLQWTEVLDLAKQLRISNKWSRLARESLGREFPQEFNALRQEIIEGTTAP